MPGKKPMNPLEMAMGMGAAPPKGKKKASKKKKSKKPGKMPY